MKFTVKKAEKFGWDGVDGWNCDVDNKVSVSYIEISSDIPKRKNTKNNRGYFILEGKAKFIIEGKEITVGKRDGVDT